MLGTWLKWEIPQKIVENNKAKILLLRTSPFRQTNNYEPINQISL